MYDGNKMKGLNDFQNKETKSLLMINLGTNSKFLLNIRSQVAKLWSVCGCIPCRTCPYSILIRAGIAIKL